MKKLLLPLAGLIIASLVWTAPAQCFSPVEKQAIMLNNDGVRLLNSGDFLSAIEKFEEALAALPSYSLARANLGIACNNFGINLRTEPARALEWFERAVYTNDTNGTSQSNLDGTIKLLGLDPNDFSVRVRLGDQAMAARRKAGAVVHYTRALSIKDDKAVKRKLSDAILADFNSSPTPQPQSAPTSPQISAPPAVSTTGAQTAAAPPATSPPAQVASSQLQISTDPKNRPVKDKWALVVGISKFQKPSLNLKFPDKDAQDFAKFLVEKCHFAPDHVKVLTNEQATRAAILNNLGDKWLPRVVRPDDLVVLYFSTHGSPASLDAVGVNYLIAADTDPDSLYASGVAMQDIGRVIKERVRSDRVIVILDACYSGNANPSAKGVHRQGNVSAEDVAQGTGQLVISSSASNQASWESTRQENSVFTRHLMNSLVVNGANTQLGEAFKVLKDRVEDEVQRDRGVVQTPVLKSVWQGSDLMLSVPPSDPRPGL